jgi:putative YphP/YqiW family bacilliredoxin
MNMHRYPELMIRPMREEIVLLGARELRQPADVDAFVAASKGRTAMLVVNSVCGCAAGSLRPGLKQALERARPDLLATVFAGADLEATERARELFTGYAPSSPAVALFRDGRLVYMLERQQIQGKPPEAVAGALVMALEQHGAAA